MPSRRDFVAMAAAGVASAATADLPRRRLGKTGLEVSAMGLGGASVGTMPDNQLAVAIVKRCYDLGVTYFDAASSGAYGISQLRFGQALQAVRDKIVLATKTRNRTYTQAEIDLNQSLSFLKTDRIDLYQIHNVMNDEDIDFAFGPRGVMELVEKAKKAGKIRFVGVTGHLDPQVMNRILAKYDFDAILIPLSISDGANKQRSFERETLPLARKKNMGIIAMKTMGAGRMVAKKEATASECLRYALSLPISTAIVGCTDIAQVEANVAEARQAKPLTAAAMDALRARLARAELAHLEPWKRLAEPPAVPEYRAD